jgi:hypothetical protein
MAPRRSGAAPAAVVSLTARLKDRADLIVDEMVSTYREEIDDYRGLDDDTLYGDVASVALDNLQTIVASAERGAGLDHAALERFRQGAARRVHQGVSLDGLLHAYVVGARVIWDTCRRIADDEDPADIRASLAVGDALFRHLNAASHIVANAYIRERRSTTDGSPIPRRDLLDALLSGHADSADGPAGPSELAPGYAVVVARATTSVEEGHARSERVRRHRAIEHAQRDLQPRRGGLLTGLRDGDVIVLIPLENRDEFAEAAEHAERFASGLADHGFMVGLSGWHPGPGGVPAALREAQSAVDVAQTMGTTAECIRFDEVVVEHIMRASPYSAALLDDVVGRLRAYDRGRPTSLLETLRAYVAADLNVSRTAVGLHVHPNTVTYRLRRIAELIHRDPTKADDLVVLMIALKADELEPG